MQQYTEMMKYLRKYGAIKLDLTSCKEDKDVIHAIQEILRYLESEDVTLPKGNIPTGKECILKFDEEYGVNLKLTLMENSLYKTFTTEDTHLGKLVCLLLDKCGVEHSKEFYTKFEKEDGLISDSPVMNIKINIDNL